MHACEIKTGKGKAEVEVIVVGHHAGEHPPAVERAAARLAAERSKVPLAVTEGRREYLLVRVDEQGWLVGGEAWRILGARIVDALRDRGSRSARVLTDAGREELSALAEGMVLGDYRFVDCRSGKAAKRQRLRLFLPRAAKAVAAGVQRAVAQNEGRRLADLPANQLDPAGFVKRARRLLRGTGLKVKVIAGVKDLRAAGFPGLVQVGGAGSAAPALVEIAYVPRRKKPGKKHLALVGKGITFDSGGLSLKRPDGMWQMKGDMGGAAAVLGAMLCIAAERPRCRVTGYLALAENLPDRKAQRPGDIYRARNGTWVHVENTDAEGRLVLADVLTYAGEKGATHLVDAATLTGACLVALGTRIAGLMGNDAKWVERVRAAGQAVGEELWPLPLYGDYRELLEHPHADLNNVGGKYAGTIAGGIFLERFVGESVKWAHLDIAGPAMMGGKWHCYRKGNTGFATRSLAELAAGL